MSRYNDGFYPDEGEPVSSKNSGVTMHRRKSRYPEDTSQYAQVVPAGQYNPPSTDNPYDDDDDDHYDYVEPQQRRAARASRTTVHPDTREPYKAQPPIRRLQPQQARPVSSGALSQVTTRRGLLAGLGMIGTYLGATWVNTAGVQLVNQSQEGKIGATTFSLVCGHSDSDKNETELHAYVRPNGCVIFTEYPGGNTKKGETANTESIREIGYSGPLSNVYLEIVPEYVGNNKFNIRLQLSTNMVSAFTAFTKQFSCYWLLVDNGHGFFELVNPKKP